MRKWLSSGQKWFLRPYFPLIRGMFVFRSGLRFSFWTLEVRKRPFSLTKMAFSLICLCWCSDGIIQPSVQRCDVWGESLKSTHVECWSSKDGTFVDLVTWSRTCAAGVNNKKNVVSTLIMSRHWCLVQDWKRAATPRKRHKFFSCHNLQYDWQYV